MSATRKPPPPPAGRPAAASAASTATSTTTITRGRQAGAQKVVIYGPGGVGKSSLAALSPNPVLLDVEAGTSHLDVARMEGIDTWAALRSVLQGDQLDEFDTIVIDSGTKAEELAIAHTLAHVKHEKGHFVQSIEGYGFGKGFQHVYDTWLPMLSDLDRHVRSGRNVVIICHVCTSSVPNPAGDDWIRYEPRLQTTNSGKASIRYRVVEWADHVLFIGYDVAAEDGKARGAGTRTIWTSELPVHIAKSREVSDPVPFDSASDNRVWNMVLGGKK